jgi:hypothetical protein
VVSAAVGVFRRVAPADVERRSYLLVTVASVCQIATLLWTWPLWSQRTGVPNLPAIEGLSGVNWGVVLVLGAVATILRPQFGGPTFCAIYVLAALGDQTRLQPEVVSLAILMTAPSFGQAGRAVARWHLGTMWCWSGVHKMLSLGWANGDAAFIAGSLHMSGQRPLLVVLLPVTEVAVGVLSFLPKLWKAVAGLGFALHMMIFLTLSPLFADWNSSVWPWNVGLAVAALLLYGGKPEPLVPGRIIRVVAVVLAVYPALFYAGLVDAYVSHNLYSSNTASTQICLTDTAACAPVEFRTWEALNVPFPPEPRLYEAWFDKVCAAGSVLQITGPPTRLTDPPTVTRHRCPAS